MLRAMAKTLPGRTKRPGGMAARVVTRVASTSSASIRMRSSRRTSIRSTAGTDQQAEKYGIPSQVEALKKRCQEKGWEIVPDGEREAFIDDGYSGSELDRRKRGRRR
jgi:hypothetical protein